MNLKIIKHNAQYMKTSWLLSMSGISSTMILFWYLIQCHNIFYVPILSLLFVRIFIIFHDMCHYNYFPSNTLNYIGSYILGMITLTGTCDWIETHTLHHNDSNKLDKEQYAQSAYLTTEQYGTLGLSDKIRYFLFYVGYFTLSPSYYFLIYLKKTTMELISIIAYLYTIYYVFNTRQIIYIALSYILSSIIGFKLFHAQHTFDGVYKKSSDDWNHIDNGLYGASYLIIPKWLNFLTFFTYNIEYHHIHHMNSKIPCYYLGICHHEGGNLFDNVKKVYLSDLLVSYKYYLYDVRRAKFISVIDYICSAGTQ